MAKSKLVKANEKIEEGAVGGFNKIADKFVDNFLTKEGESVEEAKARLAAEQKEREEKGVAQRQECEKKQQMVMETKKLIEKFSWNVRGR